MAKLLYKPLGMLISMLAGVLAGAAFKKAWTLVARQDEAPNATDAGRGWAEILTAAALQGALLSVVRAAAGRAAASGTQKLTGTWPGEQGPADAGRKAGQ